MCTYIFNIDYMFRQIYPIICTSFLLIFIVYFIIYPDRLFFSRFFSLVILRVFLVGLIENI